ncbi:vasoactive intestinal polypeptide receptor 2-like [Orbicella faveolata]|uniref:vasoactive intestinal polypeptide receptor 2-like n=1 Tax=Orbicella faveolata TaxID=48498 RepID=UPI0009E4A283|nr:vasoactive intestinal polypeptide receptor 2-like [Orbicella faveolata]
MLVEGVNLYMKLVKVFSVERQYVAYLAIGWGIPTVIVGLISAIRPSTFDMREAQYEDITCGSLKLTAEIQRTRYDSSFPSALKVPSQVIIYGAVI